MLHYICLLGWHKFLNSISMRVWCMLVVGLNDEMNNQHAQVIQCFYFQVSKWYRANYGAKDGILVHSDWYHASKVHLLYLSIIWQTLSPIISYLSICASYNPNSQHICRGSNCYHVGFMKLVHILLHILNMLGQAKWIQSNFNSYLCEMVVINYQKGEIEGSSLVLVN